MPEQAVAAKRRAVHDLGAHLYLEPGDGLEGCARRAQAITRDMGGRLVASSDDADVLAGHGTIALELAGQVREYEDLHLGHPQLGKLGTGTLDVVQALEEQIAAALEVSQNLGLEGSVEPSSPVALAALLYSAKVWERMYHGGKKHLNVGIVITAGNIEANQQRYRESLE